MPEDISAVAARAFRIVAQQDAVDLLDGVTLLSAKSTDSRMAMFYEPMAVIVLQGAMEVTIGQAILDYAPGTCFVGSIDLPVTGRVTRASPDAPYLAIRVALRRETLADLLADAPQVSVERGKCYAFGPVADGIPEVCTRLLALQDAPEDASVLGPLIQRELLYRLLRGPQAAALHQIVASDPKLTQVRRALSWIRTHLDESVPVQDMANCAGMSIATFHRHFRAATGMSPLQYQKALRLQAARRAILSGTEIARAGFAVGYESPSQFSREYARMFGLAPSKDLKRLVGRERAAAF